MQLLLVQAKKRLRLEQFLPVRFSIDVLNNCDPTCRKAIRFVTNIDLAVGATDAAVVIRSRPVHDVGVLIRFSTTVVLWQNAGSCTHLVSLEALTANAVTRMRQLGRGVSSPGGGSSSPCTDGSDIEIGGGNSELSDRLDMDSSFCTLVTFAFNYSVPDGDPILETTGTSR